jgi:hypothetical protein
MPKTKSPLPAARVAKAVTESTGTAAATAAIPEAVAAPTPRGAAKKVKAATNGVADKPAKPHKPKLVRDSFTIPKDEYQVLDALKSRALGLELHVRKSELLRAGIQALNAMADRAFLKAIGAVPTLKTGRPKAD